jgi:ribosome-binding factor A
MTDPPALLSSFRLWRGSGTFGRNTSWVGFNNWAGVYYGPTRTKSEVGDMSDPAKTRRHAERVRELVASLVREIKDPRLGMVTITDARITGDLREATVYYTVLGDATEQAATQTALESAKGMLRTRVGHALGLRHSPSLAFVLDNVLDHAKEIDDLLAEARNRDAEVQRLAAGKQYAGDPDPYKSDEDEDEDAPTEDAQRVGAREDLG